MCSFFLNYPSPYHARTHTECPSSEGRLTNDVYIVNLSMCSDVRVIKECSTIPEPPQSLNLQRVSAQCS